ncbi:MAG: CPBP family glutamic-type intramembrane protease, partial [Gemmataceae bacterium]
GPVYTVGFNDEAVAGALIREYWRAALVTDPPAGETAPYRTPMPRLRAVVTEDPEAGVRSGVLDVGVRAERADGQPLTGRIYYRADSATGREAVRYLEGLHFAALARGATGFRGPNVQLRPETVAAPPREAASLVPVLVPLILILMTMTGAVYPAIDLTAGERERGTLEILVAAPIPRLSVLLAKYFAVVTVALLTACANLGMMAVTLQATGLGKAVFGESVTWLTFVQVLGLLVLFATFFSAVLLALTSFARSFKEAQAYLIPLMLLSMMPGIMALMPGLKLAGPLAVVPLVNIVLLARDVFAGTATPAVAGVVVLVTLLYALAAVALAARIFGTEAVLSSEGGTWGDMLRRPDEDQPAASPTAALLCLAVMFPLTFLLTTGLGQLDAGMAGKLVISGAVTLAVFAGVPLLAGRLGRVSLGEGFGLRWPPALAWPAAALLGVSLWPWVHLLIELTRQAGLTTLGPEHQDLVKKTLAQWRELPAALLVVAMALLPALCEEFMFRGFLLRALLRGGPAWQAVMTTAALFAAFHLFVHNSLAVERFAPSLAMGLVLGTLAWASGSIWPGVVLHALHNATLVLMAYHEPGLIEAGWLPAEGAWLPPAVLAGSGAVAALGGGMLWWLGRKRRSAGAVSETV